MLKKVEMPNFVFQFMKPNIGICWILKIVYTYFFLNFVLFYSLFSKKTHSLCKLNSFPCDNIKKAYNSNYLINKKGLSEKTFSPVSHKQVFEQC